MIVHSLAKSYTSIIGHELRSWAKHEGLRAEEVLYFGSHVTLRPIITRVEPITNRFIVAL